MLKVEERNEALFNLVDLRIREQIAALLGDVVEIVDDQFGVVKIFSLQLPEDTRKRFEPVEQERTDGRVGRYIEWQTGKGFVVEL